MPVIRAAPASHRPASRQGWVGSRAARGTNRHSDVASRLMCLAAAASEVRGQRHCEHLVVRIPIAAHIENEAVHGDIDHRSASSSAPRHRLVPYSTTWEPAERGCAYQGHARTFVLRRLTFAGRRSGCSVIQVAPVRFTARDPIQGASGQAARALSNHRPAGGKCVFLLM